jgi:hypothetical protein
MSKGTEGIKSLRSRTWCLSCPRPWRCSGCALGPRSGCAPDPLNSAGQDGPLLAPGPLCGGESGTTGPQGNRHNVDSFSSVHGCAVEKPGHASRTCRAGARQAPSGGVVFSWVLLFYSGYPALRPSGQLRCSPRSCADVDKQKRSASPSEGGRKLLLWNRMKSKAEGSSERPLPIDSDHLSTHVADQTSRSQPDAEACLKRLLPILDLRGQVRVNAPGAIIARHNVPATTNP